LNLLKQLLHRGCDHRFSWPRVDQDGRHYQICLTCGTAYEYDWKKMRLTKKLLSEGVKRVVAGSGYLNAPHGFVSSK
jgi:hypothetical protein